MPTSHPWNPNPSKSDYNYMLVRCHCQSEDPYCPCAKSEPHGYYKTKAPPYRPDKKIRATAWLPHGPVLILFWDNETLYDFQTKVRRSESMTQTVRGWNYEEFDVRPSAVSVFQRNDPE